MERMLTDTILSVDEILCTKLHFRIYPVKEDARNFILELVNWEGPPPPAEQNLSGHKENAASIPLTLNFLTKSDPSISEAILESYNRCLVAGLLSPRLVDVEPSSLSQEQLEAVLSAAVQAGSIAKKRKLSFMEENTNAKWTAGELPTEEEEDSKSTESVGKQKLKRGRTAKSEMKKASKTTRKQGSWSPPPVEIKLISPFGSPVDGTKSKRKEAADTAKTLRKNKKRLSHFPKPVVRRKML